MLQSNVSTTVGLRNYLSKHCSENIVILYKGKGKRKVHPRTGHESPEGE
jgi:hypothetical protein